MERREGNGGERGETYLAFELYFLFVVVRGVPFRQAGFASAVLVSGALRIGA